MALTRVTTWSAGQVLTAAALNAEFDNILNNALTLISPLTANLAAGGNLITGLGLGTVSSPSLQVTGDTNTGIWSAGSDRLNISTAGTARMEVLAGGIVYIGAAATPSYANMTTGLVLDQGAADNEIFAMKSSDIAHGMTSVTETDTYGQYGKNSATVGGLFIGGYSEVNQGLVLAGYAVTPDTTSPRSTSSGGVIYLQCLKKSGAGAGAIGADGNMVAVGDGTTTRFVLDSDGDSHQDVGTAWTNFDTHDDVALLEAVAYALAREGDPLREAFVASLEENRACLEGLPGKRIVSFNDDGHHFVNMSRLSMLHTGAIRQLGHKLERCERALASAGLMALPLKGDILHE